MLLRRLDLPMPARGEPEALHRFRVELHDDRLGLAVEAEGDRPLEVVAVGEAVVAHVLRQREAPVAAVLDVVLKLAGVDLAFAVLRPVLAAEARERADARRALVV